MPGRPGGRNELAMALSLLRQIKGWEQDALAAASGVSLSLIRKIETGTRGTSAGAFGALVTALGVDVTTVSDLVTLIRHVRRLPAQTRSPDAAAAAPAGGVGAVPEWRRIQTLLRSQLGSERQDRRRLPSLEGSCGAALGLWARLERYPHAVRRALLREGAEFQDAALCELLCDKSRDAASDSARLALQLADLAVLAAERVPAAAGRQLRLEGYARLHLANALRVGGKLPAAEAAFARATVAWRAGAVGDPGLLNEARALHLEASLWRDRRELRQALALLDQALAIDRWGETPALLIGKAKALEELGDLPASISLLRQAAAQLAGDRDELHLFAVHLNLATNLCHLGRFAEAKLALPAVCALARRLGNQLDNLRVGWLAAKVAAGLGHTAEAVAGFEQVRAGFDERRIAYDAALVTMELAELLASLGRTAEVKHLAQASASIFAAQGVHPEARRALDLFRQAAEGERVTSDLIRGILASLHQARREPHRR